MKRKIVLPNVLTALGLTLGLYIIFTLAAAQEVTYDMLYSCFVLLIIAAVIDTLDGAIAKVMHLESDFGGVFDSMSDVVTFGVAPAVFVLKAFPWPSGSVEQMSVLTVITLYAISGVLRLVRFSTAYVPPSQKAIFVGLPIPAAAFSITSLSLVLLAHGSTIGLDMKGSTWAVVTASLFIAYMMPSRWRFPSLKAINVKMRSFHGIALFVFVAVCFFVLFSKSMPTAILIGTWGYLLGSWSVAIYRLASGKRELALTDIPDIEEE